MISGIHMTRKGVELGQKLVIKARELIEKMEIEEIAFYGREWTWANNWNEEGFIEVRLDRFFGSA